MACYVLAFQLWNDTSSQHLFLTLDYCIKWLRTSVLSDYFPHIYYSLTIAGKKDMFTMRSSNSDADIINNGDY
jgi:hypothetical protein